ncbi:MAG: Re/Si-specific NAD(P)(+) transhydrogenase subunit alpha [Acidobacteriota bacterium]|nr:Re/Si-specific NAD(P)(+) transhydrogenase subunit alpha [Acidobacteriota bacterium]
MKAGVPKETCPGEKRVALVPGVLAPLLKAGVEVCVERGAGMAAGYTDEDYAEKGATIVEDRAQLFADCEVIFQVRTPGANAATGDQDLELMHAGQVVIGLADPLSHAERIQAFAGRGITLFGLELLPRITRAQSMDVLSSQAMVAGYKAVLLAANALPRLFSMEMTAAGTLAPAHVFVIGAGVAGLKAIATAKRLGAVVHAYDVRPAVKEQVESLGGKFVELELEPTAAEDKGGYAKELGEEFYRRQREVMTRVVAECQVVITTAAIPGKKSPVLVTEEMVRQMSPASIIVDLAAERGGNCELTRPDEVREVHSVTIYGPTNLPSEMAYHASQMYGKNLVTFFRTLLDKEGALKIDTEDEVIRDTLLTRDGRLVNARLEGLLAPPTNDDKE